MFDLLNPVGRRVCVTVGAAALLGLLVACDQPSPSSDASSESESTNAAVESIPAGNNAVQEPSGAADTTDAQDERARRQADAAARLAQQREAQQSVSSELVPAEDIGPAPSIVVTEGFDQHAGKVYTKEAIEFVFHMYNAGEGDLVINRISSSCGCTVPNKDGIEGVTFAPGAELPPLEIAYTPRSPGDSSKIVTLFSNDPENSVLRLKIGAHLVALAQASPAAIRTGELRTGQTHVVSFELLSRDEDVEVVSIVADQVPDLRFEPKPAEPLPASDTSGYAVRIPIDIIFPDTLLAGRVSSTISMEILTTPDGAEEPVVSPVVARLYGTMAGDIRLTRPFARVMTREPSTPYEVSTNITTLSGREFEVLSVVVRDTKTKQHIPTDYTVTRVEGSGKPMWTVTLQGTTPETGAIRAEATIRTNLEGEVPVILTVTGFVQGPRGMPGSQDAPPEEPVRPDMRDGGPIRNR